MKVPQEKRGREQEGPRGPTEDATQERHQMCQSRRFRTTSTAYPSWHPYHHRGPRGSQSSTRVDCRRLPYARRRVLWPKRVLEPKASPRPSRLQGVVSQRLGPSMLLVVRDQFGDVVHEFVELASYLCCSTPMAFDELS